MAQRNDMAADWKTALRNAPVAIAEEPAQVTTSKRAERRERKEAAMAELRPVTPKTVVSAVKPGAAPSAAPSAEISLTEIVKIATAPVVTPTLNAITVDWGKESFDYLAQIGVARNALLRQRREYQAQIKAFQAEADEYAKAARKAQERERVQLATDMANAQQKRLEAKRECEQRLAKIQGILDVATRKAITAAKRDRDDIRGYVQGLRTAKQLAAQAAAQQAAEKAAAEADRAKQAEKAADLATAIATSKDVEPETNPYENFEGEAPVDPIKQEAARLQGDRNALEQMIKDARKAFSGRKPTAEEAAAVADWTDEWDRLGKQIKQLLDPKPTKTQRRKNNKA